MMPGCTQVVGTFPSVRIPSRTGALAVEVSLIAQIGHGAGSHLFASVSSLQRQHESFVDELDEPSAKLGATDFEQGDPTALYSFAVGAKGHPFHRHAGHRVFTAISGSAGAQLRFSSTTDQQLHEDPRHFVRALRCVNIPPDCLFTVRFGGDTWHQFAPLSSRAGHPAFFALSCHTNELGGKLSDALKDQVLRNAGTIPSLTELLPTQVQALLDADDFQMTAVATTSLSLDAPPGSFHRLVCNAVRSSLGWARGHWSAWKSAPGFVSHTGPAMPIEALENPPKESLLRDQLNGLRIHHEDTFRLRVVGAGFSDASATQLLGVVLEGFVNHPPVGVSGLMALRNLLVKPLGLRTSPLGCPVSSLLSPATGTLFARRFPVLDQGTDHADMQAQVVLGANDKHLIFRSCVSLVIVDDHHVDVLLGTRVHCKNLFGRFYMGAISAVHRRYVTPAMLRQAAEYAFIPRAEPGGSRALANA